MSGDNPKSFWARIFPHPRHHQHEVQVRGDSIDERLRSVLVQIALGVNDFVELKMQLKFEDGGRTYIVESWEGQTKIKRVE